MAMTTYGQIIYDYDRDGPLSPCEPEMRFPANPTSGPNSNIRIPGPGRSHANVRIKGTTSKYKS
jgi:hypothetical protein